MLALARTQRSGNYRHPAIEEGLDLLWAQAVADGPETGGVVTGGEAVGECGEGETFGAGLTLGPLVAVEPDLGRVGKVGAELDEARAELDAPDVEVVDGDPAVRLAEAEVNGAGAGCGPVVAGDDGLELR